MYSIYLGRYSIYLGIAHCSLGDYKKAFEFHQQSLSIAKEVGEKGLELKAYNNLGVSFQKLHDFRQSEKLRVL